MRPTVARIHRYVRHRSWYAHGGPELREWPLRLTHCRQKLHRTLPFSKNPVVTEEKPAVSLVSLTSWAAGANTNWPQNPPSPPLPNVLIGHFLEPSVPREDPRRKKKGARKGKKTPNLRTSHTSGRGVNSAKGQHSSFGGGAVVIRLHGRRGSGQSAGRRGNRWVRYRRDTRKGTKPGTERTDDQPTAQHEWPWVCRETHKHVVDPWKQCTCIRSLQKMIDVWDVSFLRDPSVTVDRHRL